MFKLSNKLYFFILLLFLYFNNIFAIVEGTYPTQQNLKKYSVFGSVETIGNTMMATTPPGNVNDILLTETSGDLKNIPYDAEIVAAHIFWSGSLGSTIFIPDDNITLLTKDNVPHVVRADTCKTVNSMDGFYYCSSDITNIMNSQNDLGFNGRYTVSNLMGDIGNCDEDPYFCQAKYAAWSMVVVYKSKSAKVKREILLYDSFLHLDEREDSIGITEFNITNLKVNSPARGEFTYFGLEGDRFLGVPPQDAPENEYPCDTCYDFIQLNGIKLQDDLNPPNNIWNSSTATAVDLDTFKIGNRGLNILQSGENQTISVKLGSGDGIIPNEHPEAGGGESVFLGYVLIALDTISPNFRTSNTNLIVDRTEASQGDELTYILTVTNDGSKIANNVMISNVIPPQTTYVDNSTFIDGVLVNNDINSPTGLNIGSINFRGNNKKIITFRVKVKTTVNDGVYIYNKAKIISDQTIDDPTLTNQVKTLINAPNLQTPILMVKDENSGDYLPGEWVEYTVRIQNNRNNPISNIIYKNQLPSDFTQLNIISYPFNSIDNTDVSTKNINISSIQVPARSTIFIKYRAKIKTISEYVNSGVSEEQINNREISSQGSISTSSSIDPILTDNDNGGNEHDATVFTIKKEVNANFSDSTMIVENMNGSNEFHPGDRVKYTIKVKNSASTTVNAINVINDINESYFEEISVNNGFYDGDKLTWIIESLSPNDTYVLTFTAKIKKPQSNGLVISNQASISITGRTDLTDDPTTPEIDDATKFIITASGSNFIFSTKEVIDENGGDYFQQGDFVTYVITVKNTGEAVGKNLIVEDSINSNLTDIEVFNNGVYNNNKIIWSYQNTQELKSVSSVVQLKFRAKIKEDIVNGTIITNQAVISSEFEPRNYLTDDPNTPSASDSTNFTVNSAPEITESYKTYEDLNGGDIKPNDIIRYTILVRNTGNLDVHNVKVIDNIDTDNLENIVVEDGGIYDNSVINWTGITSVAPHSEVALHFNAKIKSTTTHNTKISNQAFIMSDEIPFAFTDDPNTQEKDDPTSFLVTAIPDLSFTKKVVNLDDSTDFKPNDRVKYEIKITNNSGSSTGNITISDLLPNDLDNITVSNGGIISDNQVYFYLPPINTTKIVSVEGSIKGDILSQKDICNQAKLEDVNFNYTMNSNDPNTITENDSTCFTVTPTIKISDFNKIYTDLNGGDVNPNDEIEYELTFKNESDISLSNIKIIDDIDSNLTNINLMDGGTFDGQKIVFDSSNTPKLENIAPNSITSLKFRAKILIPLANNTVISNQAELIVQNMGISLLSDNPNTPIEQDATSFTIKSKPLIKLTKRVKNLNNSTIYKPNDNVKYTISVLNTGTDYANNIKIKDLIDSHLTNISSPQGIFDSNSNSFLFNSTTLSQLGKLGINQPVNIVINAKIKSNISNNIEISNQALLNGDNTSEILSDNPETPESDATKFVVTSNPPLPVNLKGYKTSDKKIYTPNEIVTYTITLKNEGREVANNVVIKDILDNNLIFISASDNGNLINNEIKWDSSNTSKLLAVEPNQEISFILKAKVKSNVEESTIIENQASFLYQNNNDVFLTDDPSTPQLDDSTKITIARDDVSNSTKEVFDSNNDGLFVPNEDITYKITVKNSSKILSIRNIKVVDNFPFDKLTLTDNNGLIIDNNSKTIIFTPENFPELQELAPETEVVLILRAKIKDLTSNNMFISNQAFISYNGLNQNIPTDDPKTSEIDDATKFKLTAKADLSQFTKIVASDNGYFPNEIVRYTLTVKNTGTTRAKNLIISDPIDDRDLEIVDAGNGIINGNRILFSYQNIDKLKELKANKQVSFIIKARIKNGLMNNTIISNQAVLNSESIDGQEFSDDPTTQEDNDSTKFKVINSSVLSAEKIAIDLNGGKLEPNDVIRYQIKVYNKGYKLSSATKFYDEIPTFTKYIANSTKVNDEQINDINGEPAFVNGLNLGDINIYDNTDSSLKIITFDVKVLENTPDGEGISNQANIENIDRDKTLSDDPNTQELNDPTIIYLGNSLHFNRFDKNFKVEDTNNNEKADIGELLDYNISIDIANIDHEVDVEDLIPYNTNFVNGSLQINWISQTDSEGDDNAYFKDNKVVFKLIPKNDLIKANISFKVEIISGKKVINQANTLINGKIYKSNDPNTVVQNDATITYIGETEEANLSIKKEVKDINGGMTLANDKLLYTITVQNSGNKKAKDIEFSDILPNKLEFINNSEELSDISAHFIYYPETKEIKIYGLNLDKNSKFILKFKAKISNEVQKGDKITNIVKLNDKKYSSASVVIGAGVGTASIYGDLSYINRENKEIKLKNYKIEITEIKKSENTMVYSTNTDQNGHFQIDNIKPSEYLLKYYNSNGTYFGEKKLNYLKPEDDNKLDLIFIPTGVIYNIKTNKALGAVKVFLYNKVDGEKANLTSCETLDLVKNLPLKQQGQIVEDNGLYKFNLKDVNYDRVGICISSYPDYTFPSSLKEPKRGSIESENGFISDDKYYIDFTPIDDLDIIQNNNIPLDPISESIKILKTVDQKDAKANSMVTYRVRVENKSPYDFIDNKGAFIHDILPKNFKLVEKSFKLVITDKNGEKKLVDNLLVNLYSKNITFGPFDLKSGSKVELSYRVAIGSNIGIGKYKNTAFVLNSELKQISNEAQASINIKYDFDMDMGAVIGKVYCDDNKNSYQDIGEIGLKNVTIYNDEGFSSITDDYGRYHFTVMNPGNHLIKLDRNTLLSGINPYEEKRIIRLTKGLLEKVNFPVDCKNVNNDKKFSVIIKKSKKEDFNKNFITLRGNLNNRIFFGNKEITLKSYKLKQSKKLVTEDEENTYFIKGLDKNILVNYYIYRFNKENFTNKTKLTDLYRFIQKRGKLNIKLPASQYIVFAEIINNNKVYKTTPIISMSQRIPNEKGEGLIEFKKINFNFSPQLFINGNKIINSKSGNIFKVFIAKNLKDTSVLYENNQGESVNYIIQNNMSNNKQYIVNFKIKKLFTSVKKIAEVFNTNSNITRNTKEFNKKILLQDNHFLDKFLSKKDKNNIETKYDNFGKSRLSKELNLTYETQKYVENFYGVKLTLPPENAVIKSDSINIWGYIPENYNLTINGIKAIANKDDYFNLKLNITPKTKKIIVIVKDNKGKTGKLIRNIRVADLTYFIMAFTDSTMGYDKARLDDTNYKFIDNSKVFLQGKVVLYLKGKIRGKILQKYIGKFFKSLKGTAYFNSSKKAEYEDFYINLINPERFYPIYGDKSKETQDIKSKGKLYVKITADKSNIMWGNFNTKIHNSDLIEYDKTLYGFLLDFDKKIKGVDNKATIFYSGNKLTARSLYNEFQGTGGSLYYLQSTFVKEGTERVKIIVRDRDTGIELYQKILILNKDYTINYATGTILLKEALPSFIDNNYLTSGKLDDTSIAGNPVYLSVSYQADSNFNIDNKSTAGISIKEEYKNVYITAHAISENRDIGGNSSNYSLSGMGIGYNFTNNSFIFTEFAHSSNFDNFSFLSKNGGITFKPIGEEFSNVSGNAFSLKGKLSFKDFKFKNKMLNSVIALFNYQKMDRYFYKVGNRVGHDQGGDKISLISKMDIDKLKKINLKYIGVISDYDMSLFAQNKLSKHQVTLKYDQKISSKIEFSIEHQFGHITQDREEDLVVGVNAFKDSFVTNVTSAIYKQKLFKNLNIFLQQDIIEQYDKRLTDFTVGDRFQTTIGAQYQLTNDIALIGSESIRFSGDNSTTAGVKYKIDENSSIYLNQKWLKEDRGVSNTLLGAETSLGNGGKLYGEYQLNKEFNKNTTDNNQNRALIGIGKTFKINDKLSIQGGLEHTYYKSTNSQTKYRSALSLGLDFRLLKELLFYTKHELRYDKFDVARLHFMTTNGLEYYLGTDLTAIAKANFYITKNFDSDLIEAKMSEVSLGFAFRPVSYDFLNLLGKYSLISQLRPLSLDNSNQYKESAHVISLAGIYEAPFRIALTEKVVFKIGTASENGTKDNLVMTTLWINRLSYHMIEKFDIAIEYRLRKMFNFDTTQGFLLEGSYKIKKYFYLGVGYNFTSFTDDIFYMDNNDGGGFFVRITGCF